MLRALAPLSAALAASASSPQEAAPRHPGEIPTTVAQKSSAASPGAPNLTATDSAKAQGRKTLSTAFVMIGPDGHLTVELRDGRAVVLRDVVMRPEKYCGVQVRGGPHGTQFCGRYADVAAARPGGAPASGGPTSAAPDPI
jgi:hypothetical protein